MKNLNKRNKIIIAIAGVLVIAVVAIAVFNQVSGGMLFGSAADLVITPSNPTILVGNSTALSVNAATNCAWSSSDTSIVSLVNYNGEAKSVAVKGNLAGSATITAKCGWASFNVNKVTTIVTVYPTLAIEPSNPTVAAGYGVALSVPPVYTCNWSSSSGVVSFVGSTTGSVVTVQGETIGQSATITAQCGTGGASSTVVTVERIAISPPNSTIVVGNSIDLNVDNAVYKCAWSSSDESIVSLVDYSQEAKSVTVMGNASGSATITAKCGLGTINVNQTTTTVTVR